MVKDPVLIFGVTLGLVLSFLSIYLGIKKKIDSPKLAHCVVLFLASTGVAAGFKVCILALMSAELQPLHDERLYVFLGGLAVIWASIETIARPFRLLPAEQEAQTTEQSHPH